MKRLLPYIVFCIVFFVSFSRINLHADTPRITVLLYHGLTEESAADMYERRKDRFRDDMEFIKSNFDVISLSDVEDIIKNNKPLLRNSVVITFDDGLESDYAIAAPILEEFGFKATFFVITDRRGEKGFMTWEQVKKMSDKKNAENEYLFTIGSHGCSHRYPGLEGLSYEQIKHELENSKKEIENHTGRECRYFALPYGIGAGNPTIIGLAEELGYGMVRTSRRDNIDIENDDPFDLPCLPFYDFSPSEYIGAFHQNPTLDVTFFDPVQDVYSGYDSEDKPYTFHIPVTGIKSYSSNGNLNVNIDVRSENIDMIDKLSVKYTPPSEEATISIVTTPGFYGRAKIDITVNEQDSYPAMGYFHVTVEPVIGVISYSGITTGTPDNIYARSRESFRKDIEFISRQGYDVISMDDLSEIKNGKKTVKNKAVVLNFDDGGINDLLSVVPILREYEYKATFFIVPAWIGQPGYMSWTDINKILQMKDGKGNRLFSIGSHSYAHAYPGYLNMTDDEILQDMVRSKKAIEDNSAAECNFMALPYGKRGGETIVKMLAKTAGYKGMRTSEPRTFSIAQTDMYDIGTLAVCSYTSSEYLAAFLETPKLTPPAIDPIRNKEIAYESDKTIVVDIRGIESTFYDNNDHIKLEVETDNDGLFENMRIEYQPPSKEAKLFLTLKPDAGEANVTIKAHEELGVFSAVTFTINQTVTSATQMRKERMILFPNPATDQIKIGDVDENIPYRIYNVSGRLLSSGNGNVINITLLPQGLYFLVVGSDKDPVQLKFIKQ